MGSTYLPARTFICQNCSIEFKRYGNNTAKYCSRECKNKSRLNKLQLVCMNCSCNYEAYPSEVKWSQIRGEKRNFCSKECSFSSRKGENSSFWKGGRHITKRGYIKVYMPEHPKNISGYCYEHRIVMEKSIGRYLTEHEDVHHINENKSDNRIENLQLLSSSEHSKLTISNNFKRNLLKKH